MPNIDIEKCKTCGTCVKDCFSRNIFIKDGKTQHRSEHCIHCGHCVAVCPENAVQFTDYDMTEVFDITAQNIKPDELLTLIRTRRSIRQYKDNAVEPKLVKQIIEAGRYTPTASNRQELMFVVIEKEMQAFRALVIKSLANLGRSTLLSDSAPLLLKGYAKRWVEIEKVYNDDPMQKDSLFFGAPIVILIAGDNPIDAGLAASRMELVACTNKLGVLFSGFITRGSANEKVKNLAGIPPEKEVLLSLLVGYPNVQYKRTAPRKKAGIVWI